MSSRNDERLETAANQAVAVVTTLGVKALWQWWRKRRERKRVYNTSAGKAAALDYYKAYERHWPE